MFIKCIKSGSEDFTINKKYKLTVIKKIRHTNEFKCSLKDNFGSIKVHSDKASCFGVDGAEFLAV